MAEPFFSGDQETKLDAKGRTSVPAAIRAELKKLDLTSFYAFPSHFKSNVLECCDIFEMNRMKVAISRMSPMSRERRKLELMVFARAHEIVFDSDGRTVIPKALRTAAGLEGEIYFLGRGARFEILTPAAYAAELDALVNSDDDDRTVFDNAWADVLAAEDARP